MIADWVMVTNQEIFVERDGKLVMKLVPVEIKQENKEKIRKIELKMKNIWKDYPNSPTSS